MCHLVSLPLLLWPLSPHPPAFLLTGCLSISFLTSFRFRYHLPHPSHLLSSTLAPCRMAGGPDGSVWTEAFLMTCLPQRPRLPLTPGPVTCISCRLPPSLTSVSFLHRSGDTRGRGASPLSPRLAPALSAHPPWALSGLWGKRCFVALGAQDTGPLPSPCFPQRAFSCQVPFWPFVRERGPGSKARGYLPSAEAPVTGLLCPAFAPASPTSGPRLPVWPGRAAGASDTLPTHLTPASSPH